MWKSMSGRTDDLSHKVYGGLFRDLKDVSKGTVSSCQVPKVSALWHVLFHLIHMTISSPWRWGNWGSGDLPIDTQLVHSRGRIIIHYYLIYFLLFFFIISTVLITQGCHDFSHFTEQWGLRFYEVWWGDGRYSNRTLTWNVLSTFPARMNCPLRAACLHWQALYPTLLCHLQACLILRQDGPTDKVFNVCLIKIWL